MANLVQIEKYLVRRKLPFKVVDLNQKAFTVRDVVKSGIDVGEVVKTLIVRNGSSTRPARSVSQSFVALALCGNDRVDFKKVRAKFGSKSELAAPEEVLKVVGVPVGAVCPILVGVPLYVDRNVMNLQNVHMGSGDLMCGLEMKLEDLLDSVGGYKLESFSI